MIHVQRSLRMALAPATLALLTIGFLALAPHASARSALAELRVEGPDGTLDPGTWYVTGSERIKRSGAGDECARRDGTIKVPGPTAMGLPQTGSGTNPDVRQVRIRRDEAGLFVCEIASVLGRPFSDPDGFSGWSYWQDYVAGSAAADQVSLHDGDHILWVYSDFGATTPLNQGDAIELRSVDAGTTDGELTVKVIAHQFDGQSHPLEGATFSGATTASDLGGGFYDVTVPEGFTTLQATNGLDIPSQPAETCSKPLAADCPAAQGRTIVGSLRDDRLEGTKGWDEIDAGRGDDVIDLSAGGEDLAECGSGDDLVIRKGHDDSIGGDCERVRSG